LESDVNDVLSGIVWNEHAGLDLGGAQRVLRGLASVVAARGARADKVGVDEGGAAAVDVLEALPDDGVFVEEDVIRDEGVERRVGRGGGLVEDGEVGVAEEGDERAGG
jgi:hypothetical protein